MFKVYPVVNIGCYLSSVPIQEQLLWFGLPNRDCFTVTCLLKDNSFKRSCLLFTLSLYLSLSLDLSSPIRRLKDFDSITIKFSTRSFYEFLSIKIHFYLHFQESCCNRSFYHNNFTMRTNNFSQYVILVIVSYQSQIIVFYIIILMSVFVEFLVDTSGIIQNVSSTILSYE